MRSDCTDLLGVQVSNISLGFYKQMAIKVHPLDRGLKLEGTSGLANLYLGYVKVNLQIPGNRGYHEDGLLLVILTTTYAKKVPVMVGFKSIDRAMTLITMGELARATATQRQTQFSAVMSQSLLFPCQTCKGWSSDQGAPPP